VSTAEELEAGNYGLPRDEGARRLLGHGIPGRRERAKLEVQLGSYRDCFRFLGMALRSMPLDAVLKTPQVVERVERMRAEDQKFRTALLASPPVEANVVVTDFRELPEIPVGNRVLVYTRFPEATVSVRLPAAQ
jgi:hypothetical protein